MREVLGVKIVISNKRRQGSFTRDVYLQLLGNLPGVPWKALIFKNASRPKAMFTLWPSLQGTLLTVDRLIQWMHNTDPLCSLCKDAVESWNHLFTECIVTRELRAKLLKWMGRQNFIASTWDQLLAWEISNRKGKSLASQSFRMIFAEACHAIWKEETKGYTKTDAGPWKLLSEN